MALRDYRPFAKIVNVQHSILSTEWYYSSLENTDVKTCHGQEISKSRSKIHYDSAPLKNGTLPMEPTQVCTW